MIRLNQIVITSDGSSTLFVPELNEHYHSVHGAVNESTHVFINAGLNQILKTEIHILEVGFGTGLNAFLSCLKNNKRNIHYLTVEKYPLNLDVIDQINFGKTDPEKQLFIDIHEAKWDEWQRIADNFSIKKVKTDFRLADFGGMYFDLVYFDAFAPDKHPDLWTKEVFQNIYDALNDDAILVTYCAKGVVRRTMQEVGFRVERIPGPPPKKEMLRAIKPRH